MLLQIATEYQKIGELDKTDAIINQAISKVTTIPKERAWIDPKLLQSFGLRDIAHKLLKYHQYDKALEIVDKIPLAEYQVSLLSDISLAYIQDNQQQEKTLEILDRAWLIARENNHHDSIVSIAEQYSKLGHYQQALEIIKKTSDNYNKIASLINMAKIYAKSQQPVDQETIKYLQDLSSKYDLFN